MPQINYSDRVALITGASSGIGAAIADHLSCQGLHVILVARRLEKLSEIQNRITSRGGKASIFQADLSIEEERDHLIAWLQSQRFMPDILVNNAGFAWYGYFNDMPWQIARDMIALNIDAATHLTLACLPHMLEKKFGRVINIGSISGKMPEQGIAIYGATKSFLDALTTSGNRDLQGTGVSISVIRPGPVKTEFFDNTRTLEKSSVIPAERFAIPPEMVARAAWRLVRKPHRYAYVPWWLIFSPLLEVFFSSFLDLVGPVLLKWRSFSHTK